MTKHRIFRARPLRAPRRGTGHRRPALTGGGGRRKPSAGLMECNYDVGTCNARLSTEAFHFGLVRRPRRDRRGPARAAGPLSIVACSAPASKASLRGDDGKGTNDQADPPSVCRSRPGPPVRAASRRASRPSSSARYLQGSDLHQEHRPRDTGRAVRPRTSYYELPHRPDPRVRQRGPEKGTLGLDRSSVPRAGAADARPGALCERGPAVASLTTAARAPSDRVRGPGSALMLVAASRTGGGRRRSALGAARGACRHRQHGRGAWSSRA